MNMDMAGFTFDRERIGQILAEIERQKRSKKDFVGDTQNLEVIEVDNEMALKIHTGGENETFSFTRAGREQVANGLRIATSMWDRMEAEPKHRKMLGTLATHFLKHESQSRLIRTLDSKVRAFLSARYRILDNADLFFVAAEEFGKVGAEIWDARLYEDGFRLYAVQPGLAAEVKDEVTDGAHFRADGDRHVAAVSISNSETGKGKFKIRPATLRMVCQNWNVWDETLSQIHLGRKREEEGWISDETQRLEDQVTWRKTRDIIQTAFDPKRFEEVIAKLRGAKVDVIPDPVKAVDVAVELTGLPESSKDSIRAKFIASKDFTRYGLVQAVTAQSHENVTDEEKDSFDDAGARILAASVKEFVS